MKDAYYFSHDSNARNDEKILMLRAEYGWEGYGIYWALVEMMFESAETALDHSKAKGIAVGHNIDITLLQSVINTCISEGLFDSDDYMFWSESLRRRKDKYLQIKEKKSEAGKKGMAKRWGIDNADITELKDSNNSVITKNNKEKERKGNESKLKESKVKEKGDQYSDEFKIFWDTYPRKEGKASAYKRYLKALKKHSVEDLLKAAENYAKTVQGTDPTFIKKANNFFGEDVYIDYINIEPVAKPENWRGSDVMLE